MKRAYLRMNLKITTTGKILYGAPNDEIASMISAHFLSENR